MCDPFYFICVCDVGGNINSEAQGGTGSGTMFAVWVNLNCVISNLPLLFLTIALLPIPERYCSLAMRCYILHQITLLPETATAVTGGFRWLESVPWYGHPALNNHPAHYNHPALYHQPALYNH